MRVSGSRKRTFSDSVEQGSDGTSVRVGVRASSCASVSVDILLPSLIRRLCSVPDSMVDEGEGDSEIVKERTCLDSSGRLQRWRSAFSVWRSVLDCDALFLTLLLHSGCLWAPNYSILLPLFRSRMRTVCVAPHGARGKDNVLEKWLDVLESLHRDYPFDMWALAVLHYLHIVEVFYLETGSADPNLANEESNDACDGLSIKGAPLFGRGRKLKKMRDERGVDSRSDSEGPRGSRRLGECVRCAFHSSEEFASSSSVVAEKKKHNAGSSALRGVSQASGKDDSGANRGSTSSAVRVWWRFTIGSADLSEVARAGDLLVAEWWKLMSDATLCGHLVPEDGNREGEDVEGLAHLWFASAVKFASYVDGVESPLVEENAHISGVALRYGKSWPSVVELLHKSIPSIFLCVLKEEIAAAKAQHTSTAGKAIFEMCEGNADAAAPLLDVGKVLPPLLPPLILLLPFHLFGKGSTLSVLKTRNVRQEVQSQGPKDGLSVSSSSHILAPPRKRGAMINKKSVSDRQTIPVSSHSSDGNDMAVDMASLCVEEMWLQSTLAYSHGFIVKMPSPTSTFACGLGVTVQDVSSRDHAMHNEGCHRSPSNSGGALHINAFDSSFLRIEKPLFKPEKVRESHRRASQEEPEEDFSFTEKCPERSVSQTTGACPRVLLLRPIPLRNEEAIDGSSSDTRSQTKSAGLIYPYVLLYSDGIIASSSHWDISMQFLLKKHEGGVCTGEAVQWLRSTARVDVELSKAVLVQPFFSGTTQEQSPKRRAVGRQDQASDFSQGTKTTRRNPWYHYTASLFRIARRMLTLQHSDSNHPISRSPPTLYERQVSEQKTRDDAWRGNANSSDVNALTTSRPLTSIRFQDALEEIFGIVEFSQAFGMLSLLLLTSLHARCGVLPSAEPHQGDQSVLLRITEIVSFVVDLIFSHPRSSRWSRAVLWENALVALSMHPEPSQAVLVAIGLATRLAHSLKPRGVSSRSRDRHCLSHAMSLPSDGASSLHGQLDLNCACALLAEATEGQCCAERLSYSHSVKRWLPLCLPPAIGLLFLKAKQECQSHKLSVGIAQRAGSSMYSSCPSRIPSHTTVSLKDVLTDVANRLSEPRGSVAATNARPNITNTAAAVSREGSEKEECKKGPAYLCGEAVCRYVQKPPELLIGT